MVEETVEDHPMNIPTKSSSNWAKWFQRRILICKSLRMTTTIASDDDLKRNI
jgi:hypothetical protein